MDPNGYGYRPVPTEMDGATPSPGAAPGSKEAFQNKQWVAEKALRVMRHDSAGFATVDHSSVYGAALALPQLARSAGWTISYTGLAMRGLLFMVFNNLLQGFLLYMISKEERIINKFGSQMFLCDFAAHMERCPEGPNCVGPGGTSFTPSRLYPFELWTTRTFVRDSLVSLFPERKADILKDVDPGEYGVESYWLRLVCCFLFVLGLWHDLAGSWDMLDLLWYVPTQSELWIVPLAPKEEEEAAQPMPTMLLSDIAAHEAIEMDFVQFRVAGMPLHWKLFNLMCLLFPKMYLWLLTVDIGIVFLMETSEIEDMIINCVALGFILQIDELMMGIMPPECGKILESMKGYAKENRPPIHVRTRKSSSINKPGLGTFGRQTCGWLWFHGAWWPWSQWPASLWPSTMWSIASWKAIGVWSRSLCVYHGRATCRGSASSSDQSPSSSPSTQRMNPFGRCRTPLHRERTGTACPTGGEGSRTCFTAPPKWSEERKPASSLVPVSAGRGSRRRRERRSSEQRSTNGVESAGAPSESEGLFQPTPRVEGERERG